MSVFTRMAGLGVNHLFRVSNDSIYLYLLLLIFPPWERKTEQAIPRSLGFEGDGFLHVLFGAIMIFVYLKTNEQGKPLELNRRQIRIG